MAGLVAEPAAVQPPAAPAPSAEATSNDESSSVEGVLLYYWYCDLRGARQREAAAWLEALCARLGLVGRVRVAADGINVTVGGRLAALREHAAAVAARFSPAIDFKLSASLRGRRSAAAAAQSHFTRLRVQLCREVVTLGVDWGPPAGDRGGGGGGGRGGWGCEGRDAAPRGITGTLDLAGAAHVEPRAFHELLAEAAAAAAAGGGGRGGGLGASAASRGDAARAGHKETVLLDVRNQYETEIGRFQAVRRGVRPRRRPPPPPAAAHRRREGGGLRWGRPARRFVPRRAAALSAPRPGPRTLLPPHPCSQPGVETIDPGLRAFSELPAWLDANQHRLAERRVLMYCTGGVRCERASAYLRRLGAGFQDVVQLQGGIQRYLEAFPGPDGFFRGANFVFDERAEVAPAEAAAAAVPARDAEAGSARGGPTAAPAAAPGAAEPVGRCRGCSVALSDYGPRQRCAACRMLVLVCPACLAAPLTAGAAAHAAAAAADAEPAAAPAPAAPAAPPVAWTCELCARRRAVDAPRGGASARRLRLLCLHGFRQTGRGLEGRTHALRRKLSDLAEFVFMDAPHELPAYAKPQAPAGGEAGAGGEAEAAEVPPRQQEAAREGGGGAAPPPPRRARRAWMVVPEQYAELELQHSGVERQQHQQQHAAAGPAGPEQQEEQQPMQQRQGQQEPAPAFVDPQQHLRQAAGWGESWAALRAALAEGGPWDGLVGFSQGAACAAAAAALQQREAGWAAAQARSGGGEADAEGPPQPAGARGRPPPWFRFVICCSGFVSPHPEHQRLLRGAGGGDEAHGRVELPSLHVWGAADADWQISPQESAALADCFAPRLRSVMRHGGGHLIPATRPVQLVQQLTPQQLMQQQGRQRQDQQLRSSQAERSAWSEMDGREALGVALPAAIGLCLVAGDVFGGAASPHLLQARVAGAAPALRAAGAAASAPGPSRRPLSLACRRTSFREAPSCLHAMLLQALDLGAHAWVTTHLPPAVRASLCARLMSDAAIAAGLAGWVAVWGAALQAPAPAAATDGRARARLARRMAAAAVAYGAGGGRLLHADPALVSSLKHAFHRSRPSELLHSFAFPSGHTTAAAFVTGALLYILLPSLAAAQAETAARGARQAPPPLGTLPEWLSRHRALLWAGGTACTAAGRVAADAHWSSDVLAGACVGALVVAVTSLLCRATDWLVEEAAPAAAQGLWRGDQP
eukprot:scaffold28.g7560.t1